MAFYTFRLDARPLSSISNSLSRSHTPTRARLYLCTSKASKMLLVKQENAGPTLERLELGTTVDDDGLLLARNSPPVSICTFVLVKRVN
jgi:hypothetical protein